MLPRYGENPAAARVPKKFKERPLTEDTVVKRLMQRVQAIPRGEKVIDIEPGVDDAPASGDDVGSKSDP
jgi:hypothetical protein